MRRIRAVVVFGLVGVAGLATGCKDQKLRDYLAKNGPMEVWEVKIQEAICQLEENTTGLQTSKRICPGGPPSITPPPKYPPN